MADKSAAAKKRPSYLKRQYIVNKNLQYTMLVVSLSYVIAFLFIYGLAFVLLMATTNRTAGSAVSEILRAAKTMLLPHAHFWPIIVLALLATAVHSVFVSHKIAGALYRFSEVFRAVTSGVLPMHSKLRKGDYMHEEMDMINEMTDSLRLRLGGMQQLQADLKESITELEAAVHSGDSSQVTTKLATVAEQGQALEDLVNEYRLSDYPAGQEPEEEQAELEDADLAPEAS